MKFIKNFPPKCAPSQILVIIIYLTQVANSCFRSCCCRNGDAVNCRGTELLPLPPSPANTKSWCGGERGSVPDVPKIGQIWLTNTKADHIDIAGLSKYPNVQNVSVAYSNFQTLGPRAFCVRDATSRIEEINAIHNKISKIDERALEGLSKLKRLYLTGNQIRTISVGVFSETLNIEVIWLNENEIRDFDPSIFSDLHSLDEIDFSSNLIEVLHVFPKSQITSLRLRNNSLTALQSGVFRNLETLRFLDLSKNKIKEIPEDLFTGNHELRHLNLNNNKLKSLGKDTLSHLCVLRSLNLRYNQLKTIHVEWFASIAVNSDEKTEETSGNGQQIEDSPANGGNPWSCEEDDPNFIEYASFLTVICKDVPLSVTKLTQYLNLRCPSGRMLIDVAKCRPVLPAAVRKAEMIMSRYNTTARNETEIPTCHFLSPRCTGLVIEDSKPYLNFKLLTIYASVAVFLTALLAIVACQIVRYRTEKRQSHTGDGSRKSSSVSEQDYLELSPPPDSRMSPSPNPETPQRPHTPQPLIDANPLTPTPGFWDYCPPGVNLLPRTSLTSLNSFYPDSFSYLNSVPSRRGPRRLSEPNSFLQSADMDITQSSCSVTRQEELVTPPPVPPRSANAHTRPKTLRGSVPVVTGEAVLKDHNQSTKTDQGVHDSSEYIPMAPQTPIHPPPIPPRSTGEKNGTVMQDITPRSDQIHPTIKDTSTNQCPSYHHYSSVIDPLLSSIPPYRPPMPPPADYLTPDCCIRHHAKPVLRPMRCIGSEDHHMQGPRMTNGFF